MEPALLKYDQIEAIAAVLRDSPRLAEIEVRNPGTGVSLRLRRARAVARPASAVVASPTAAPTLPALGGANAVQTPEAPVSPLPNALTSATIPVAAQTATATAGLVGVFRPVESRPIAVGDTVNAGQVLGYIESMRLMNECSAPLTGTVSALLVADGQPVEYGQPLFDVSSGPAPIGGGEEL